MLFEIMLTLILVEEKGDADTETDTDTYTFLFEKIIPILIRYFPAHEFQYGYNTGTILLSKSIGLSIPIRKINAY